MGDYGISPSTAKRPFNCRCSPLSINPVSENISKQSNHTDNPKLIARAHQLVMNGLIMNRRFLPRLVSLGTLTVVGTWLPYWRLMIAWVTHLSSSNLR